MPQLISLFIHLLAGALVACYVMPDGARWAAACILIAAAMRLIYDLVIRSADRYGAAVVLTGGVIALALGCSI